MRDSSTDFDWSDPFRLDDQLDEGERMVREAARAYAQEKLQPRVLAGFRDEHFDREIMNEMGALGFLGPDDPARPMAGRRPPTSPTG